MDIRFYDPRSIQRSLAHWYAFVGWLIGMPESKDVKELVDNHFTVATVRRTFPNAVMIVSGPPRTHGTLVVTDGSTAYVRVEGGAPTVAVPIARIVVIHIEHEYLARLPWQERIVVIGLPVVFKVRVPAWDRTFRDFD